MSQIMEAFRSLTVLDIKRNGKLGWASILHVLEARAMTLRSPPTAEFGDDTPANRALCAFTIRPDDRDVKAVCDVPILAPYQPARSRAEQAERYVPYTVNVTDRNAAPSNVRQRRNPSSMGSRSSVSSGPRYDGVPERFRRLEGTCYEWVAAGQPSVNQRHPCPSSSGHRCTWDHFFDNSVSNADIDAFTDWCQSRARAIRAGHAASNANRSPSTTSGAAHRRRRQGRAGQP